MGTINYNLLCWKRQIMNNHHKIIRLATWITNFSLSLIYRWLLYTLSFDFWCKKICIICTTSLLIKTPWVIRRLDHSWKQCFLLIYFKLLFFPQNAISNWMRIYFFNTAIIIFCLIYWLNISDSKQNLSISSLEGSVSLFFLHFRNIFPYCNEW